METPIIIWSLIAGIFMIVLMINFVHRAFICKHHFVEVGSEREEFFIPGDPLHDDDDFADM